jgi:hypothetical protein
MEYATKDQLFGFVIGQADAALPSGATVRVRGLNRIEAATVGQQSDLAEQEMRTVALGLVDPSMTLAEVRKWYRTAPAPDIEAVAKAIHDLTQPDNPKGYTKSLPE